MLRQKVYIETTVISYLTGRVSSSLSVASHQQTTQRWWDLHRASYDLFISPLVVDEIRAGDPVAAAAREQAIAGIAVLATTEDAFRLAQLFLAKGSMPKKASDDALHVALAAVYGTDYLLTWNCTHIANASIRRIVERLIFEAGYSCPTICTPEELLGGEHDE